LAQPGVQARENLLKQVPAGKYVESEEEEEEEEEELTYVLRVSVSLWSRDMLVLDRAN
jgi:hypothetical protein